MSDTSREAQNVLRRLNELGGPNTSIIFIILDTTASMGSSFEAVKKTIIELNSILSICGITLIIITYGDYNSRIQSVTSVTGIHTFETFKDYNFRNFPTGDGGDCPEAVHSAFCRLHMFINLLNSNGFNIIKPDVIFITDASPHSREDSYFELEKKNITPYGFIHTNDYLRKYIGENLVCSTICTTSVAHIYTGFGNVHDFQILLLDTVLQQCLKIINIIFERNSQMFNFKKINADEFCRKFREFVIKSPNLLTYLTFLSNAYYNNIRGNKSLLEEHSKFVDIIKTLSIPPELLKLFKNAQVSQSNIQDLYRVYGGDCIIYTGKRLDFSEIKDLFGLLTTGEDIGKIKRIIDTLQIKGENTGIPIEAIAERLELLAAVFCVNEEGYYPEFTHGILNILACGVILYCKIPQIVDIFKAYMMSPNFIKWLSRTERTKPDDTNWNRVKLQFILNAVSKIPNHPHIKPLERLIKMVEIVTMIYSTIDKLNIIIKKDVLSPLQLVKNSQYIPMFPDVLMQNMYVSSIGFIVSYEQVCNIIDNMKASNAFYKKSDMHYDNIRRLAKKFNGLVLSIYSINCGVGNNVNVPEQDGTHYGYLDSYALNSYVNPEHIIPNLQTTHFEELNELYEKYVGPNGEHIFQNVIPLSGIIEGGPQMVTCCKKSCSNIYARQDSSNLGQENTICGACRRGVQFLPMYKHTCADCKNTIVTGVSAQQVNPKCVFCMIPETVHTISNISIQSIMAENKEQFAKYFGIPDEIFSRLVSFPSMAKIFRENPEDMNTSAPIPDIFFSDYNWTEKKTPDNHNLKYKDGVIPPGPVQDIMHMIETKFMVECGICYTTLSKQKSKQLCQNQHCFTRYCTDCISSIISVIKKDEPFYKRNLECPHCTMSIKAKIFSTCEYPVSKLLAGSKGDKPYDKLDRHKIYICTSRTCGSDFPFCIENMGACGEAEGAQAELIKRCHDCEQIAIMEAKRAREELKLEHLEQLPTGHYIQMIDGQRNYIRPCPNCNDIITHDKGCFHMTCKCGTHFCWCCGFVAESTSPFETHPIYDHLETCEPMYEEEMRSHENMDYTFLYV